MITDNQDLKDGKAYYCYVHGKDYGNHRTYNINYFEPNIQTNNLTRGRDKMTNINDFKAGDKVRCISTSHAYLSSEKEYEVLHVDKYTVRIIDDTGIEWKYNVNLFEPVIEPVVEPTTQANDEPQVEEIFKAGMRVRCVKDFAADLTVGKEYELLNVGRYVVQIIDDSGDKWEYHVDRFEPVTQANDGVDSTVAKFKVGDKIYCNVLDHIETVKEVLNDKVLFSVNEDYMSVSTCCQATQENYEMLCKLYPHNRFEKPTVILKGNELCRAMLERGDKCVPCYVSNVGEKEAEEIQCEELVTSFENDEFIANDYWQYAVPFDPRTGEVLTPVASDYL